MENRKEYNVRDLSKAYGEKKVLDSFSLRFPQKGVVTLFGPSGCGKTTLVHLLAGLLSPDEGEVHGFSESALSMVFQEDRLLPWYTVMENLLLVRDGLPRESVLSLLAQLGLEGAAGQYPEELSGGMRRRVAFARALAYGGEVLLLDEPFKGLDLAVKERLIELTLEYSKENLVLLITHDVGEAARLSDQVHLFSGPPLTLQKTLVWDISQNQRDSLLLESLQKQLL